MGALPAEASLAHPSSGDELAALQASLSGAAAPHLLRAAEALEAALRLYTPAHLLLSFNGGKDATALLHLARAACAREGVSMPRCVFWRDTEGFPEVESFVADAVSRYGLELVSYDCSFAEGMRDAIERLGVRAVLMGTREADPNGAGAEVFQPSSRGWPPFMRINPLLRWSYHHVWEFLRGYRLPYCALYDRGYTSLGVVSNTRPNPALLRPDGSYAPAHELLQSELERGGRPR